MLYNAKWEVKADPFSLESLIAWLERQPAKKLYCYSDAGRCLLAQWFSFCGKQHVCLGNVTASLDGRGYDLPTSFQRTALLTPHTFGAALDRARSALALQRLG